MVAGPGSAKRFLGVAGPVRLMAYPDGSRSASLLIDASCLRNAVVEVSLLLFNLSEQLTVAGGSGDRLVLGKSDDNFGQVVGKVGQVDCGLSVRQLEAILSFLLIYERDRLAEVDHLDIEVGSAADNFVLVVKAADSVAPMSAEQAAKLIGD